MTKRNHEDNHSFTEHLKTKKYGKSILIDWEQCIGECFDIKFNGEVFKVEITGYEKRNGKNKYVKLKSDNYGESWVSERRIKAAEYGYYTTNPVMGFLYQVGDEIEIKGEQFKVMKQYREEGRWEKKYELECQQCGGTSNKTETDIRLNKTGCCVCKGKSVKRGVNDLETTAPWIASLLLNKEDGTKYSVGSNKKVWFKCPSCGEERFLMINSVYRVGLCCPCNKHRSIPERFCFSILKQLGLDFETQYGIENKRFDFFIKDSSTIIEVHGKQHYLPSQRKGGRTLEEEQENDKYKRELAKRKGIKNYIEIDCRQSDFVFLRGQFEQSELAKLYSLDEIDWSKVFFDCQTSLLEQVVDLYHQGLNCSEISRELNISKPTTKQWLKNGIEAGMVELLSIRATQLNSPFSIIDPVKHIETGVIFANIGDVSHELSRVYRTKMSSKGISRVIKGESEHYKGLHFERATKEEFLAFKDQNQLILPERLELPKVKRKDFGDKISRSIDLSSLPYQITRKGKIFTWEGAVGKEVPFVYDKVQGTLLIKAIERINGKPHLTIQLEDYPEYRIDAGQLRRVGLGNYLKQLNLL